MMDKMKIEEIFSDKEFVKELVALKDNAAVQAALKAKGLDLTEEKIAAIRESMAKKTGELSDEQLEQISGGGFIQEVKEQLEQIPGGGIIQDVKDLLEIAETVGEMASALTDDSDIITHGHGVSGSWNKEQNSDIITNGTGASGGW